MQSLSLFYFILFSNWNVSETTVSPVGTDTIEEMSLHETNHVKIDYDVPVSSSELSSLGRHLIHSTLLFSNIICITSCSRVESSCHWRHRAATKYRFGLFNSITWWMMLTRWFTSTWHSELTLSPRTLTQLWHIHEDFFSCTVAFFPHQCW